MKHWPKDRYGEFYGGDSYIILHTKENDEGKKEYDVFFWLGSETTQVCFMCPSVLYVGIGG